MIARTILPWCRALLRALRTDKRKVGGVERFVRGLLLVPIFGALLVVLRLRLAFAGPLSVDGVTDDGVKLRCRLPDFIPMYVHLFGNWEPDLLAFLRRSLRPGDVFVDVGANIGCVSALASRLVGPGGTVVAIEPSPPVIAALEDTIARNDITNVQLVQSAVTDREEELVLFAGPSHNTGLTATVSHRGMREQGRVRAAPLGDLVPQALLARARLVKIDVEGAEDRVLAGMLSCLDRLPANAELVVELSPTWWADATRRPIDVLQPFLDRGFHVYLLPNNYWPWRYLWPADVGAPRRLRDLAVLERRVARLDVVLSRRDTNEL